MDRLAIDSPIPYDPDEAAMHVARYSIALPFAKGRTVLDSSCGEGHGSWLLAQNGATHVTGVDTSAEAIRTATAIFQAPSLSFFECEKTRLTDLFPSSSFDLVVSLETIQHFSNPEDYLRALQTVATADAIMIISCPNDHWYYPERSSNPYHYRKYSLAEFQELTSKILGPQVSWHIGTALFGFVTEPIAQQTAEHSSAWAYGITVKLPTKHHHNWLLVQRRYGPSRARIRLIKSLERTAFIKPIACQTTNTCSASICNHSQRTLLHVITFPF